MVVKHKVCYDCLGFHPSKACSSLKCSMKCGTIADVSDIMGSPPTADKNQAIKAAILARMLDSPDTQLHKLLKGVEPGDKRPSQLFRHMRTLAGTRIGGDVLRVKWLDLLPQPTSRLVLLIKNQSFEEHAEVADEAPEIGPSVMANSYQTSQASTSTSNHQRYGNFAHGLSAFRLANTQLVTITRNVLQS
ncbi:unnamed protein product [Ceutorhynchus assimilis]|uniref:Uncharacterized protein n=1 Tax=Ceutorhynchus assimilis TaxID=467358 RepID=A0A9N9M944_9CUCU|nr:unnamed protein product [Ceutorhynchus assimilis]